MTDPELIYLDLQVKNNFNTGNIKSQVVLTDNRNTPIVQNASNYKMSVVRFTCDTNFLPVFLVTIKPEQSDPNLTIYSVTLENNGFFVTKPIIWSPEMSAPVPPSPSSNPNGNQQALTSYYYLLNYQHFIKLINKAYKEAMDELKILDVSLIGIPEPYLFWNTDNLTAEMRGVSTNFNVENLSHVNIYMNVSLYALFSSFSAKETFLSNERDYKLKLESNNTSNIVGSNVILKQNYSTIANWSPVSSIVFASTILPIRPSNISSPITYRNGLILPAGGSNNSTINIISDISTNEQSFKPNIIYNPSAEYRFIDLLSSGPISNVNILVFWKSKTGLFVPLVLNSGSSASMKILFQKK